MHCEDDVGKSKLADLVDNRELVRLVMERKDTSDFYRKKAELMRDIVPRRSIGYRLRVFLRPR